MQDNYLMRLVAAMEEVFMSKHGIHPSLVSDVHQYFYRRTGVIGVQPEEVTAAAKKSSDGQPPSQMPDVWSPFRASCASRVVGSRGKTV